MTLPRRGTRGFTLLEMGVTSAVMLILAAVGMYAYTSVRDNQVDAAGKSALTSAQIEGRRVISAHGYTFPADLLDRLREHNPKSGAFTFVAGPSHAPHSTANPTSSYQVSVGTDGANRAVYAMQTRVAGASGHCWVMVEDLSRTDGRTTSWGFSKTVAVSDCAAARPLVCPTMVTGTYEAPTAVGDLRYCPSS